MMILGMDIDDYDPVEIIALDSNQTSRQGVRNHEIERYMYSNNWISFEGKERLRQETTTKNGKQKTKEVIRPAYDEWTCFERYLDPGNYTSATKLCEALDPGTKTTQEQLKDLYENSRQTKTRKSKAETPSKKQKLQPSAPRMTREQEIDKAYCRASFSYNRNTDRVMVMLNPAYALYLKNGLHEILGFKKKRLIDRRLHIAEHPPLLNRGIYNFYIYCSLCAEVQVGNQKAPLLQVIGLDIEDQWDTGVKTIMFNRLMYVPVTCTSFNSVHVEIRDDAGELIRFNEGRTVLTLHLRKKRTTL